MSTLTTQHDDEVSLEYQAAVKGESGHQKGPALDRAGPFLVPVQRAGKLVTSVGLSDTCGVKLVVLELDVLGERPARGDLVDRVS